MYISFNLSPSVSEKQNTIAFSNIKSLAQLNSLNEITESSDLHRDKTEEHSCTATIADEEVTSYTFTITLPIQTASNQCHTNFRYLFDDPDYITWKIKIISQFPTLTEAFTKAENEAKCQEELSELKRDKRHNSFHHSDTTNRIAALEKQLHSSSPRHRPL